MTDIPQLQNELLRGGEVVNVPNKPSDYTVGISICKQTVPEGVHIHCRVCASTRSLCCKGSEPEGGGAIIGRCCGRLREIEEDMFFVLSSVAATLVANTDWDCVLQKNNEFVGLSVWKCARAAKEGWLEP